MKVREWRPALRFGWHSEAANQSQALGAVAESVSSKQTPDPVAGDLDATPLRTSQLQADPVWTPAREGDCHGQNALLNHR